VRSNTIARIACLFGGLALVLAACGPAEPVSGSVFDVTIKDFKVRPSSPTAPAGMVTLSVSNIGPTTHEFVVVRTDLLDGDLPIGADGLSVDEDRLDDVDEIEGVEDGSTEQVTVRLDPGRYVFFCNFEGHYLAGMHAAVRVVGDD
jgi:uncharacterized cupredoxin-like copper-binding protein